MALIYSKNRAKWYICKAILPLGGVINQLLHSFKFDLDQVTGLLTPLKQNI
jgi:hypothetical protein